MIEVLILIAGAAGMGLLCEAVARLQDRRDRKRTSRDKGGRHERARPAS